MSDGHPLLALDAVSRFYENGSVRALDQVSLRANAGETIALTGASGCGKSTLLSLIGLLDQPTAGRLRIGGQAFCGGGQVGQGAADAAQIFGHQRARPAHVANSRGQCGAGGRCSVLGKPAGGIQQHAGKQGCERGGHVRPP